MLLKELTMQNFRQYKDKETIKFSTKETANITLIKGDNTSGKTTILQAFLWCFYGTARFKSRARIFNEENAFNMVNGERKDIEVKVELEHGDIDYIMVRKQFCEKRNNKVNLIGRAILKIYQRNNIGEIKEVPEIDVENVMNEILPKDLSDYFFYDTERFGNITEKENLTESVKGILGLKVLENTLDHLGRRTRSNTVVGQFYNGLNKEGNKEIEELVKKIEQTEKEIKSLQNNIERQNSMLESYEKDNKEKEKRLRDMASTMELQKEIDRRRNEINQSKDQRKNLIGRFYRDFQNDTFSFFINPLIRNVRGILEETEVADDYISGIDAGAVDDIIKRGYCVCGTQINRGSKEYDELRKTLEYLPPQSIGTLINSYQNQINLISKNGGQFHQNLVNTHTSMTGLKEQINQSEHEIERQQEKIEGIENAEKLQRQVNQNTERIKETNNRISRYQVEKALLEERLKKDQQGLDNLMQINEKNKETLVLLKYAEEVAKQFQDDYDKRSLEIKKKLDEKVNDYFKKMYHGNRNVHIDSNFKVTLYSGVNNELLTDESTGLETVKNFAFIAGLVDLAKQKLSDKNKDDLEYGMSEVYPLVLDAPFSNVDEKHVMNISKVLPGVARQLILIVVEKDWNFASRELESRVGKVYFLEKQQSETYTKVKEIS